MKIFLLSNDAEIINTLEKYVHNSGDDLQIASDINQAKKFLGSDEYDALYSEDITLQKSRKE